MSFAQRVVLITGAGSGIGRQLALTLAAEGARIAGIDRNAECLAALSAEMNGKAFAGEVADVTDLPGLRAAVRRLEEKLGPTDLLIANAGVGKETSALDFRAEDVAAQINVNLIGVANSVDAVLAGMRQRRSGHLVVLSSLASYRGLPMMAGYCASKAGVSALFESLRVELEPLGIAVTIVCPGWIRTALTSNIDVPQPYMMEVGYATGRILDAIRRRRRRLVFPPHAAWQVRLLRFLPAGLSDWIIRRKLKNIIRRGTQTRPGPRG
jgi:NAD(P)-dependent dehydrogenase (short-subunit alcohol dehydrogenase family)